MVFESLFFANKGALQEVTFFPFDTSISLTTMHISKKIPKKCVETYLELFHPHRKFDMLFHQKGDFSGVMISGQNAVTIKKKSLY